MNRSKFLFPVSLILIAGLTVASTAIADTGAPPTTSSDVDADSSNVHIDFGKGRIRMREKTELAVAAGAYQNSQGSQGVSASASANYATYVNGTDETRHTSGFYFNPGISARLDVKTDQERPEFERVEIAANAGSLYRLQAVLGRDLKLSRKAAEEKAKDPRECESNSAYEPCTSLVSKYEYALEDAVNCDSSCTYENEVLSAARRALEEAGISIPRYSKIHLTADAQFGKVGYRYKNAKALGASQNIAIGDIAQGSLHGAFTLNGTNIDVCALAGIGGVAGRLTDDDKTLDSLAWQFHASGCAGVQLGKVANLRGEAEYQTYFAPKNSSVDEDRFTLKGSLANIANSPVSLEVKYDWERESVGPGARPAALGTGSVAVKGIF